MVGVDLRAREGERRLDEVRIENAKIVERFGRMAAPEDLAIFGRFWVSTTA